MRALRHQQRLARADRDPPEGEHGPAILKRAADVVVLANRGAANRDQHIGSGGVFEGARQCGAVVGQRADPAHLAQAGRHRRQHRAVGGGEEVGRAALGIGHELVAAFENGEARSAGDLECGMPRRPRQAKLRRAPSPAPRAPARGTPARDSPTIRHGPAPATAKPSIALRSAAGWVRRAARSAAR